VAKEIVTAATREIRMLDPELVVGQDLAIALLTHEVAISNAMANSDSGSEEALFSQDKDILEDLRTASDQAKVTAVMTLEMIAWSLVMQLSASTGRPETEIVADVSRRVRARG